MAAIQPIKYKIPALLSFSQKNWVKYPFIAFFKHGQLDFSKALDSICDHLTSIYPENFWVSWWMGGMGHTALASKGRERRRASS